MREKLPEIMRLLPGVMERGERWAEIFLLYMLKTGDLEHKELLREFRRVKFKYGEEWIMTTAERLLEEGRKQGLEKGREQGIEQGIEQGLQKGREEKALETARRMKAKGLPLTDILEFTGLSREKLREAGILES